MTFRWNLESKPSLPVIPNQSAHAGSTTRERMLASGLYCLDPRNWARLARRVSRNPEFFADLLEYAQAAPATRRRALQRIVRHLYRRALEGDAEDWAASTKGYASELISQLEWLKPQLQQTPYLGALRTAAARASRWDYALLINHQLLGLKQEFAGYGLGASTRAECWLPSARRLSLLEVTQAWSLLTNAGHLFGTFATERALLFELLRGGRLDEELLAGIDTRLREHAAPILGGHSLYEMHYVLACWRASRAPMPSATRDDCIALLRAFFECRQEQDTPVHYWAFRTARQLAHNRMHLYMGVGNPVDAVHDDATIRAMSPWADLGYESRLVAESSLLGSILKTLDEYQSENYFSSAEVASDVLLHVRAFRHWWKGRGDLSSAVDALFGEGPANWPSPDRRELRHFSRLKVPGRADEWLDEVQRWLDAEDERAWEFGKGRDAPERCAGRVQEPHRVGTRSTEARRPLEQSAPRALEADPGGANVRDEAQGAARRRTRTARQRGPHFASEAEEGCDRGGLFDTDLAGNGFGEGKPRGANRRRRR